VGVGGEEKKCPQKIPTCPKKYQHGLRKGKKKNQLEFTTLVSLGTGRDEKDAPIRAPSIHIGALVGASSFWPI
jgi:hypothetical protein